MLSLFNIMVCSNKWFLALLMDGVKNASLQQPPELTALCYQTCSIPYLVWVCDNCDHYRVKQQIFKSDWKVIPAEKIRLPFSSYTAFCLCMDTHQSWFRGKEFSAARFEYSWYVISQNYFRISTYSQEI